MLDDSVVRTIITDYESAEPDIRAVRNQVFIIEQRIDRELEFDGLDRVCKHAVVYEDNVPLATGRIDLGSVDLDYGGKVGRVAVLSGRRREGLGTLVMRALEETARKYQLPTIWFHAQRSAVEFYHSLGYEVSGEEFDEANIPHVKMSKDVGQA